MDKVQIICHLFLSICIQGHITVPSEFKIWDKHCLFFTAWTGNLCPCWGCSTVLASYPFTSYAALLWGGCAILSPVSWWDSYANPVNWLMDVEWEVGSGVLCCLLYSAFLLSYRNNLQLLTLHEIKYRGTPGRTGQSKVAVAFYAKSYSCLASEWSLPISS